MRSKMLLFPATVLLLFFFIQKVNAQVKVLPVNGGVNFNSTAPGGDTLTLALPSDGFIRLNFTSAGASMLSLTLCDINGVVLAGPVNSFNNNTVGLLYDGLAAGNYLLKVVPISGLFFPYKLSDSLFSPAEPVDAEPNDIFSAAVPMSINSSQTGHIGYSSGELMTDFADWYKVVVPVNGLLRVYLAIGRSSVYSNNDLDVYVNLYQDESLQPLGIFEVLNPGEPGSGMLSADGLAPGNYYIKISPYPMLPSPFASYTLRDSLFPTILPGDPEPNNTAATAVDLPVNGAPRTGNIGYSFTGTQTDGVDWYKVTTSSDGLLRIYLSSSLGSIYSSNLLDVFLSVCDSSQNPVNTLEAYANGLGPDTAVLSTDGLAAGTYYIKLQPGGLSTFSNYTISDSLFATRSPNDAEPNDNAATASAFALNSTTTGHVGYYYYNHTDLEDWYKVTTTAQGPLHIYLRTGYGSQYSNNLLGMEMVVYSGDGTTVLAAKEVSTSSLPGIDSIVLGSLPAGSYYILVNNIAFYFGVYTLTNSVVSISNALPVTWLDFSGKIINGHALLNWTTGTEINNKGFIIQNSSDGNSFHDIGYEPAQTGNSNRHDYVYSDDQFLNDSYYYRLKQEDLDGHFNYSPVITLGADHFYWNIDGNPSSGVSTVRLNLPQNTHIVLQLIAADGKIISRTDKGTLLTGSYTIPVVVPAATGFYIVQLIAGDRVWSKQIVRKQ
jgi:hypothetical protein